MKQRGIFAKGLHAVLLLAVLLFGCSSTPKADVTFFMMPREGLEKGETRRAFDRAFAEWFEGEDYTVALRIWGKFDDRKLLAEVVGGRNHIFLLSREDFVFLAGKGLGFPLEDHFDPSRYKDGVVDRYEGKLVDGLWEETYAETHLYGVPVHQSPLFKKADEDWREPVYAMIMHKKANENAIKALKKMLGEEPETEDDWQ